ncbi:MAG: Mitochondrial fission protein [Watsoniomyces obsoletus]|nr:MAG: Mitochondrial fission protein [Watsoniomyces obsoletus]
MAKSVAPFTWVNGFRQPSSERSWESEDRYQTESDEAAHYTLPPSLEPLTTNVYNSMGLNVLRTWPTLYDGTNSPNALPKWWKPSEEVDVLICGAGPCGLEVALSLLRQGVSFRIIDKADAPLIAGRGDGLQPRFLESLHALGLAQEAHEEGPLCESSFVYKDGKKLYQDRAFQSDSRYRGVHIITQGQLERIYVRDLYRHQVLVERSTTLQDLQVESDPSVSHPVRATIMSRKTGREENIQAKFLVGSDGASSALRKRLQIPFDGTTTDIFWAIIDCVFETDFPYPNIFGLMINSEHGGCVIVPREDGYLRIYTQIDAKTAQAFADKRQAKDNSFLDNGGRVDIPFITPEEALEQTNRIFAPYTWKFAAPLSWFAVWRINERVARTFSTPDMRVHLAGDAAHVHSAMGAFGLNASMLDATNLAWKIGMCAKDRAKVSSLMPTYDLERRLQAERIIRVSGIYFRFVCSSRFPLAQFQDQAEKAKDNAEDLPARDGTVEGDQRFLGAFYAKYSQFLVGVDVKYEPSVVNPSPRVAAATINDTKKRNRSSITTPITVLNGVRAPNPRICFTNDTTGYLYDKMTLSGSSRFHVLIFGSDMQGPVRERVRKFSQALGGASASNNFYNKFGGPATFNVLLILKALPFETAELLEGDDLRPLRDVATVLYDDRAPDEDAHYWYGVNHGRGAIVVIRPDLWIGTSVFPEEVKQLDEYFSGFLNPVFEDVDVQNGPQLLDVKQNMTGKCEGEVFDTPPMPESAEAEKNVVEKMLDLTDHRAPVAV